jgi:hypothetical protein
MDETLIMLNEIVVRRRGQHSRKLKLKETEPEKK